ncbi:MAG: hypothetical protein ACJ76V_15945 [Thermoleophilaceae bacterium]
MAILAATLAREIRMGFLDKARELAEQAQKKIEQAQDQFNESQDRRARERAGGDEKPATPAAETPAAPVEPAPPSEQSNASPDPLRGFE